jgi:excisionase family DNA binding protein
MEMNCENLLTAEQVASIFQVPKSWVYKHARKRAHERLPHVKLGKYVRFRESEIKIFLERLRRV